MDLLLFLALNALTLSVLAVASMVVYRPTDGSDWLAHTGPWLSVNVGVVVVGAVAWWLAPEWAATLILGLFVPLVLAPILLFNLSQWLALSGRTAWAGL